MKWTIPAWVAVSIIVIAILVGAILSASVISIHRNLTHVGRNIDELEPVLKLGTQQSDVIKRFGHPSTITSSVDELQPYCVLPPKKEKVLLYPEYPWRILVYVNAQQHVSRVILVRAP